MVISLPVRQKCYFGYGATRPRRGERSQCAAFEANKKAKGWRTAEALHEGVTTICGESQAGRQRAQEILARRTDSGFSCRNCFDYALKQARAFAALALVAEQTEPAAAAAVAVAANPVDPEEDAALAQLLRALFDTTFGAWPPRREGPADVRGAVRLRVLRACDSVRDTAALAATCRGFFRTYTSPDFRSHMEAQTCWWRRQWKAYKEKVRALQKAGQQVQTRDLAAARKATEVAELKSERAQKAFLRAVQSRSAERERRDDRCTSLAADVRDLQEEVVALRAESERLESQVRALRHSQGGGLVELEGRVYSLQETLPSMRKGLRLRLRDAIVQFYVKFGVAMHKTLPAVKYLLEQIGLTVLENCEESKQLTTRALIEIAEMDRVDLAFELILRNNPEFVVAINLGCDRHHTTARAGHSDSSGQVPAEFRTWILGV